MANDNVFIYDHETGIETIREMTDAEQAIRDAEVAEYNKAKAAQAAEAKAIEEAKIAAAEKLIALGIDPKALGL